MNAKDIISLIVGSLMFVLGLTVSVIGMKKADRLIDEIHRTY